MKAASAALLLAHCAQVSCFAPVPAAVPGAQRPRGAPSAVGVAQETLQGHVAAIFWLQ